MQDNLTIYPHTPTSSFFWDSDVPYYSPPSPLLYLTLDCSSITAFVKLIPPSQLGVYAFFPFPFNTAQIYLILFARLGVYCRNPCWIKEIFPPPVVSFFLYLQLPRCLETSMISTNCLMSDDVLSFSNMCPISTTIRRHEDLILFMSPHCTLTKLFVPLKFCCFAFSSGWSRDRVRYSTPLCPPPHF